jgi:hypothetical protein
MSVPEISVQIKNMPGQLVQISAVLAEADINIRAIAASSSGKSGWVRLVVDNSKLAEEALEDCGYDVEVGEALAVRLYNEPGALDNVLRILADTKINVDYIYTYGTVENDFQIFIIGVQSPGKAEQLLKKQQVEITDIRS